MLPQDLNHLGQGQIVTENGQLTVLTVDDNDILRYTMKRMLSDAGYRVIEARTGGEALKRAKEMPDLITLDINLPDIDGFQVCAKLKSNPQTSRIPVLHVSGTFVEPEYRVRGLQGGADAYLAEPKALGEAYRSAFGRHYPTMAVVEVKRLVEKAALLEIEATAIVPV